MAAAVLASLVIAAAPVVWLRRHGAAWVWFGLGIASWFLAWLLIGVFVSPLILNILALESAWQIPPVAVAVYLGLVCAACELGMAALFLRRRTMSAVNVLAFGAGIGVVVVLAGLGLAAVRHGGEQTPMPASVVAWFLFVLERAITLVRSVSPRVLVYVALRARWPLPAAVAVLMSAGFVGVCSYGAHASWGWWDWDDVGTRAYGVAFLAIVGAVEVAVAWWAWRTAREHGELE